MATAHEGRRKQIEQIIAEKIKRGESSPRQSEHYHSYYEVFYMVKGSCRYLLNDSLYKLKAGEYTFVCPGDIHFATFEEDCDIITIYFQQKDLTLSDYTLHSHMGSIPTLYIDEMESLLQQMLTETGHLDEYSADFMNCYLNTLLLKLMRHSVLNEEDTTLFNTKDADILRAAKYIYHNYKKPLSLEEVASQVALSPTYFSKKFKQVLGMGYAEYLNSVRLKHAKTALLTTNNTITDIALENGFNDSNYFKDIFKKVYGKSPREYRKTNSLL